MSAYNEQRRNKPKVLPNYWIQIAQAEEQQRQFVADLIANGYKETLPGVLESPDGKTTVEL